jgi:hypothetical protein
VPKSVPLEFLIFIMLREGLIVTPPATGMVGASIDDDVAGQCDQRVDTSLIFI